MAAVNLSDLVVPVTQPEALASELSIAVTVGLPTTAWQPLGISRAILWIDGQIISSYSSTVALMAQGAYGATASKMVDVNGNPITEWMDLRGTDQYNVSRIPATYASCPSSSFAVTNAGGASFGPYAPGQLHFSNPVTKKTYKNSATVTIAPNATTPVALVADEIGAASTSGPGTVTSIVAPSLANCTCTNSGSVIGSDAESNAAYYQRCLVKLGALSPNGPAEAYDFVSKSILDSTQRFYNAALTQPITKTVQITSPAVVQNYVANAAGAPSGPDVAIVDAAIQRWAVPLGTTATNSAAANHTIGIGYTVYVPTSLGYTAPQVETAISDALAVYFETIPIGGLTDAAPHIVPWSALLSIIRTAIPGITSVTLASPSADVTILDTEVAVLGTISPTVVFT